VPEEGGAAILLSVLAVVGAVRVAEDDMERGRGLQVEVELETIAAAHEQRRGICRFGSAGVIRGGIDDVEGAIDILQVRVRMRMDGVPGLGGDGKKVSARRQSCELVGAEVVGAVVVEPVSTRDACAVVIAP